MLQHLRIIATSPPKFVAVPSTLLTRRIQCLLVETEDLRIFRLQRTRRVKIVNVPFACDVGTKVGHAARRTKHFKL